MIGDSKQTRSFILILAFQFLFGVNVFMSEAQAQTPTPDPELEAAQREAALAKAKADKAEQEKKEAEAERDKLKAIAQPVAAPNITAPPGKVTTDSSGFVETQILGQEAARVITFRFAKEITSLNPKPKNIIIYSSSDITALSAYMPVLFQLQQFNAEFEKTHKGALLLLAEDDETAAADVGTLLAAPAIASGVVKSVAELAQLFRSETTFSNKDVPVSEDTIVSYLVARMSGINIYYPSLFPVELAGLGEKTEITDEFGKIQSNKFTAENDGKSIDAKIAETTKLKETDKSALEKAKGNAALEKEIGAGIRKKDERLRKLTETKNKIQFLVNSAEQITKTLETPDAATKITPLTQLIRSARLKKIMTAQSGDQGKKTDDTYTLRFNVTANGTTKIKQWLFFDAKVRHSAGARVTYQVFDKNGLIIAANSFQFYFDWKSSKEVRACLDKPCLTTSETNQNFFTP